MPSQSSPVQPKPARKPLVLFVNRQYPPQRGSAGRLMRELARAFARDGWQVQVLTTDVIASDDPDGPVKVRRLKGFVSKRTVLHELLLLLKLFWAMIWLKRPDVIITLSDPPMVGYVGHLVSRLKRTRHVHWCHDVFPDLLPHIGYPLPGWISNFLYVLSRRAMNGAARVIVPGRCMARYLVQHGVQSGRIALIPHWPELTMNPHINPLTGPQISPRLPRVQPAAMLEGDPKFRVLHVGTVGFAHPVDTILDAATILDSMHPEIEFLFVGDSSAQAQVLADKNRRGLSNVRVLPFQPSTRLRDIMESGDVHLISLKHEAVGMVVSAKLYASLAAGRPCVLVGPEQTETGRVILDYGAGAVVPQGAAADLAQKIVDYRMREDIWFAAQGGALKAAAAYTAEDMIRLWLRKTREILRQK